MRLSDSTVERLLVDKKVISKEDLDKLKEEQKQGNRPLQSIVVKNSIISDKNLTKLYADYAEIPFVEINPKEVDKEILLTLPEKIARQYNAVVFGKKGEVKWLAMEDPDDVQAVDFIQKQMGSNYQLFIATKDNILQVLDNYRDGVAEELDDVIAIQEEDDADKEEVREEDISEDSPIAKTVNLILEYAIRSGASDIHIEPREENLCFRKLINYLVM